MNNAQQANLVMMILVILLVIAAGLGAIALLRRNDRPGLKVSIKAVVITILVVFSVIVINIIMLGLNEG